VKLPEAKFGNPDWPPPLTVVPTLPSAKPLKPEPATTFGLVEFGHNDNAGVPFARNSNGWLSVVPIKLGPNVVPLLPPIFQKAEPSPKPVGTPVRPVQGTLAAAPATGAKSAYGVAVSC